MEQIRQALHLVKGILEALKVISGQLTTIGRQNQVIAEGIEALLAEIRAAGEDGTLASALKDESEQDDPGKEG